MPVRSLIDRIAAAFGAVPPRAGNCSDAISLANEARNTARSAARLIEGEDPRAAAELRDAADRIHHTAKGMWSL